MLLDITTRLGAAVGAAFGAALAAFRAPRSPRTRNGPSFYVRLSAQDSDRVEKIEALLNRLIALEEQTQNAVQRLTAQVTDARLEQARRQGYLEGRLDSARPAPQ